MEFGLGEGRALELSTCFIEKAMLCGALLLPSILSTGETKPSHQSDSLHGRVTK